MVRKLVLAVASSLAYGAGAFALGLGELQLQSNLNQTFSAVIELRDVEGLNPDEVLVRLGSTEDFARAGIERNGYLLDFRFKVRIGTDGRGEIVVTSIRPVTEPAVEFLVNVAWPTGRLQRNYNVFLDPPRDEVLRPSAIQAASSRTPRPSPRAEDDYAVDGPRRSAPGRTSRFDGESYGPTRGSDTAWKIAARVRPSGEVTVRQTMIALQRLNPDAFIDNNVNLLKAGQRLQAPSVEQARAVSDSEARAEIAAQTAAWRGSRPEPTPPPPPAETATPVTNVPIAQAPRPTPPPRDEVRIVTPPPAAGAAPGAETALAGSEEERDRLSRELAQASGNVSALQQQSEKLNTDLATRDAQIAELQRQIEEIRKGQPAGATSGGLLDSWLGKGLLIGLGLAVIAALALLNLWDKARKRAMQAERERALPAERLERTVKMAPDRGTASPRPSASAGVAGATATSAAVVRPRAAPVEPSLDLTSDGFNRTAEVANFDKTVILADPAAEARRPVAVAPPTGGEPTPTSDVVSEADIYIAYGRFPQAISFLQSALEREPERNDARLKLMEAYAETRDGAGFTQEAQELLSRNPSEAELRRARQLQARLPGLAAIPAEALADSDGAFDKTLIDASMADEALHETLNSAAVELDLDLDRTDLLAEVEPPPPLDLDLSGDERTAESRLDFDLTLDGLDAPSIDDRRDELGGDLGMEFRDDADFDPDRTTSVTGALDDESEFDLTLDGRTRTAQPVRRLDTSPDDDSDLSLTLDSTDDVEPASRRDDIADLETLEGSPVDDDLEDFLSGDTDEARTKLDLARAYIDMGDEDGARDILGEVLNEGSDGQKLEARELLARLG